MPLFTRRSAIVAVTLFGALYTGATLSYGYAIRQHEYAFAPSEWGIGGYQIPSGGLLLLLPMFTTWASDIGAYAFGRMFGKRKLIPSVSPGKTIAGAVGGVIASMVVAWAYQQFILAPATHLGFTWRPIGVLSTQRRYISPSRSAKALIGVSI